MNIPLMIISGLAMLVSRWVGGRLKKRFAEFSQLPISMSGREVAEKMLADRNISDVSVISTAGQLTDHYNPRDKTVNLSSVVYEQRNIAAAAVAAHEVGHAVQHSTSYAFLTMRSKLVPMVNISSKLSQWVISIGFLMAATGNYYVFMVGIALFAMTTLFTVITLPVEFNASSRALNWLEETGISESYQDQAKNALFWAAMTYTVAAIASLGQLLYFIMRFLAMKNRR
jgi:uncharacterized protein